MTMFQNRSTKDEIETSIRTFQSVRDERKTHFLKLNEEMTKMGGKTYSRVNKGKITMKCCDFQYTEVLVGTHIPWVGQNKILHGDTLYLCK